MDEGEPKSPRTRYLIRVTHSSGMLEGKYTAETTFPPTDHRSHRSREWLLTGLQKLEQLRFLHEERGMTIGQAALKFILAQPAVTCVIPATANPLHRRDDAAAGSGPLPDAEQRARLLRFLGV